MGGVHEIAYCLFGDERKLSIHKDTEVEPPYSNDLMVNIILSLSQHNTNHTRTSAVQSHIGVNIPHMDESQALLVVLVL